MLCSAGLVGISVLCCLQDHTEVVNSLQFSPDGRWVVSASGDSTVKVHSRHTC